MTEGAHNVGTTHRADRLTHLQAYHDDCKSPSAERRDGELVFDIAHLCIGIENAHVVELAEHLGLHLETNRVIGREQGQPVDKGLEAACEFVVLVVVVALLDMIPAQNLDLAQV